MPNFAGRPECPCLSLFEDLAFGASEKESNPDGWVLVEALGVGDLKEQQVLAGPDLLENHLTER